MNESEIKGGFMFKKLKFSCNAWPLCCFGLIKGEQATHHSLSDLTFYLPNFQARVDF